jgi:hypothetical protein
VNPAPLAGHRRGGMVAVVVITTRWAPRGLRLPAMGFWCRGRVTGRFGRSSPCIDPSRSRRPGPRWWASALLLVAFGWLVTPHAVPVYDGVGMPDEPYRYVNAPRGAAVTAKPTGAQDDALVVAGVTASDENLASAENGPQVTAYLPQGGLAASTGTVTINVVPEAPSGQPVDGRIDGNVYRLSITDPAGPVTFTAKAMDAAIYLRATTAAQPGPVVEYRTRPGRPWHQVSTSRAGNDVYAGKLPTAGEYALVFLRVPHPGAATSGRAPAGTDTGSGHQGLIVVLLVSLVLMLGAVLAVRRRAAHESL